MNTYTFTYYGFIPGYNDFDQDWFDIKANTIDEAWKKVEQMKLFAKSGPVLVAYNGNDIKHLEPELEII